MEIDLQTIRALASPTRVDILSAAMEGTSTPTGLSDEVGKTKSTVSSHLEDLVEAGLLEKESEDGRRRVMYRPTGKAEAIVDGKKRKVSFSLVTSLAAAAFGASSLWKYFDPSAMTAGAAEMQQSGSMGAMSMDSAGSAAGAASQAETVFLAAGLLLLTVSLGGLALGYLLNRLKD